MKGENECHHILNVFFMKIQDGSDPMVSLPTDVSFVDVVKEGVAMNAIPFHRYFAMKTQGGLNPCPAL